MYLITNPDLIEMIDKECRGEDVERFLLRVLKQRAHLQSTVDEIAKKTDKLWPARR